METAGLLGAPPLDAVTAVFIQVFNYLLKLLTTVLTTTRVNVPVRKRTLNLNLQKITIIYS